MATIPLDFLISPRGQFSYILMITSNKYLGFWDHLQLVTTATETFVPAIFVKARVVLETKSQVCFVEQNSTGNNCTFCPCPNFLLLRYCFSDKFLGQKLLWKFVGPFFWEWKCVSQNYFEPKIVSQIQLWTAKICLVSNKERCQKHPYHIHDFKGGPDHF